MEINASPVLTTENTENYIWGNHCNGWHFVNTDDLSVIRETMPCNSKEKLHYHEKSMQFFFILNGIATFEIDNKEFTASSGSGIIIHPGAKHRIINNGPSALEFLVVSRPRSHGDRINLENEY